MGKDIQIKVVSNGYFVSWIKYLEKGERVDSQKTRSIEAVALDKESLLRIIDTASADVEILAHKYITGSIFKD